MKKRSSQSESDSDHSIDKLRKLRRQFKTERTGYHGFVHETMASAMGVILKLRSSNRSLRRFLKLTKVKRTASRDDQSQSWITQAVMVYVTDAKSKNAMKLAWKRARVLDHLHDFHGISPKKIPAQIRQRGGIEAIIRLAAKENPRRPSNAVAKEDSEIDASTDNTKPVAPSAIYVKIKPRDLNKVRRLPSGKTVKLFAKRVQHSFGGPMLTITKVIKLKQR
jgi:hypothetical protein